MRKKRDKILRGLLYERQKKLLGLAEGHESVCLPGQLVKINPKLVK